MTDTPETFTIVIRFSQRTLTSRDAVKIADWIIDEMDPADGDLLINYDSVRLRNIPTIDASNHVVDHVANTVITEPGFQFTVIRN
jgi:hypothetical protein